MLKNSGWGATGRQRAPSRKMRAWYSCAISSRLSGLAPNTKNATAAYARHDASMMASTLRAGRAIATSRRRASAGLGQSNGTERDRTASTKAAPSTVAVPLAKAARSLASRGRSSAVAATAARSNRKSGIRRSALDARRRRAGPSRPYGRTGTRPRAESRPTRSKTSGGTMIDMGSGEGTPQ